MRESGRQAIVLAPGQGRAYRMGGLSALFKADQGETEVLAVAAAIIDSQYALDRQFGDAHFFLKLAQQRSLHALALF